MNNIKSIVAAALLAVSGLNVSAQTLLNASYDVAREFYKEYNSAFVANYKKTTGKDLKIDQAHGGSSAQARAVNDGLDADVVTMNTTTDIEFLASKGIVAQTETMLEKVDALLLQAGSDREHMLSATVYVRDIKDFAAMNEVWDAWVPEGHAPARACGEAKLARDVLKVEIIVTAAY